MNDFRNCYQSAVKDMGILGMKDFHMDASQCMDKGRHNRRMIRRMRRSAATVFSAACVVFLCGFGTVKAAEYFENVIQVKEWGFESADAATMARNEAEDAQAYIVSEEVGSPVQNGGSKGAADGRVREAVPEEKEAVQSLAEEVEVEEMPVKNYSSFEEFQKNEDIIFPQPSISTEAEEMRVTVCGEWAMIRYDMDGKVIWVERTDYADTQGHASSKVFPGGVCNERHYTTAQGYTYTLVDSVKEDEDDQLQIHGAVSVGTYEAYIDFVGYTEEEAKEIIESIDLSLYE